MAIMTYAEFKAEYQHGYGLATSTQLSDAYRQYRLKGTLPTSTAPTPEEEVVEEEVPTEEPGVTPTTITPTAPTTALPSVPPLPTIPTITMPTPPTPPTIVTPTMPEPPVMPEPPKIEVPEAPTPPVMPEVPTVPPYEPSPEQVSMEEEYAEELAKWREAGGYGIPEETQIQMIQRATDILKARETESIRVMRNNMERREITNSGFVFANEMTIKSNTTVAIANSITDVQIKSALMKMASFEKMMGSTAQFIGYLAQESAKAYAPKMAQWGMEAQYGLVGYEVAAQYKMAGYSAEVAGIMAQAQIDAQYGLTAVEIASRYGLTEYQAQVAINNAQAQIEAKYGLAGYGAQVQATMAQFQANTLAVMTEWQGKMDLVKLEINQAYNLQNMDTLAQLQLEAQNDQQLHEIELAEMEIEASQEAAAAEGAGQLLGTASGAIATIIAK